ncbi:MAG: M20/M25/M40 family metallo-hydrolase [Heliobacteriaceae bacterium]|nr:M20/M25/M40 family metallo-hydrolase [Heliobacteriaceae bacterium]
MVQRERIVREFIKLCSISSPGGRERKIADQVKTVLVDLGLEVEEDAVGVVTGGNAGNVFARVNGTGPGPALFFSAHLDTVNPCDQVVPVVKEAVVYSDGTTILGADDKAGIVAILEMLRMLKEINQPHPTVEVIFTVQEEGGLKGAKAFDTGWLTAQMGYVLDSSGPVGSMVIQGPAHNGIEALLHGQAAHAGVCPEEGISAVKVAARAINRMRLGRIDPETTANIGTINGGTAANVVPERVLIKGEARSLDPQKLVKQTAHMVACFEQAAQEMGAKAEVTTFLEYPGLRLDPTEPVVALAVQAATAIGLEPRLESTGGGSDANVFNGAGLPTVNFGIGMQKVHTLKEHIAIRDLETMARLLCSIVRQAGSENGGGDAAWFRKE